eukprot:COSAG02_NODE_2687_length_8234_cov_83.523417_6_plen_101_part_00
MAHVIHALLEPLLFVSLLACGRGLSCWTFEEQRCVVQYSLLWKRLSRRPVALTSCSLTIQLERGTVLRFKCGSGWVSSWVGDFRVAVVWLRGHDSTAQRR